jgi:hypothetical protein
LELLENALPLPTQACFGTTALDWHNGSGSIIAMHEQGTPHVMSVSKDRKLDTLGRTAFGGELSGASTKPFTGKKSSKQRKDSHLFSILLLSYHSSSTNCNPP